MKTLVLSSVALLSLGTLFFLSCQKEDPGKPRPENHEKAEGKTSCSVSCFWGSCSITCKGGNTGSLGGASCNCVGIGPFGILGSVASCSCGHLAVSVKGMRVGPEIILDEVNTENLVFLSELIKDIENPKMMRLKESLQALIDSSRNSNGEIRAKNFNRFIDDIAEIEYNDAVYLRPHLLNRAATCGREL